MSRRNFNYFSYYMTARYPHDFSSHSPKQPLHQQIQPPFCSVLPASAIVISRNQYRFWFRIQNYDIYYIDFFFQIHTIKYVNLK